MRKYIILYKPFLVFLGKFFLTYILLTLVYQGYLQRYGDTEVDSITTLVADNSKDLLRVFAIDFKTEKNTSDLFIKLIYKQKYIARMVEGCNAISIIILFIAFIVSFSRKIKTTILFILKGSVAIYILNVIRIALLCVLLYYFPEYEKFSHRVLFPLLIYGFVFVLWIIWIAKFSLYVKNNTPKQS
ncbi:exosortase family protein XrtF [Flavobacterium sp.]|uniref:exosortase family protein XrtF n=1 Tax=Flavobacterium sp. TaxID=239 RepID=UPI003C331AA2